MKTLISVAVLAFILLTASNAFAEGKFETMLMKEGWVKLTAKELTALKDVTASDDFGWAEDIDPSGTKFVLRGQSGNIKKGKREITADGQYCHHYDVGPPICRFLWKRGKVYLRLSQEGSGMVSGQFTFEPGNTENL